LLVDGHYRKYSSLPVRAPGRGAQQCRAFERIGLELFAEPAAGVFVWERFPYIDDSLALAGSGTPPHPRWRRNEWQFFTNRDSTAGSYALDSVAVSRPRVLSRREFVIERGDLVQPIDDLFVGHCGRVATSPFRFLAESVASVETVVFGSISSIST
jgi:hypothetical protein